MQQLEPPFTQNPDGTVMRFLPVGTPLHQCKDGSFRPWNEFDPPAILFTFYSQHVPVKIYFGDEDELE